MMPGSDASSAQRILVVRNDKLGDLMLAFPSFALLKENCPEAEVSALVPPYTAEMAEACRWIDHLLIDPEPRIGWRSMPALRRLMARRRFDAVIALYSTSRVGCAAYLSRIPYRLAPATKAAQVFYNHRLAQRRSRSEKPESVYNQDLIRYFLQNLGFPVTVTPKPPFLRFNDGEIAQLKRRFCASHRLDPNQPIIFIHPGSGGSARNLSTEQFAALARSLQSRRGHTLVITSGPGEASRAEAVAEQLGDTVSHVCYRSTKGLRSFAEHIQFADLFISGSTGPLHIAGALDVPTAAFYPRRRSATALRWQTLNSPARRLSFSPAPHLPPEAMDKIDPKTAAEVISRTFLLG